MNEEHNREEMKLELNHLHNLSPIESPVGIAQEEVPVPNGNCVKEEINEVEILCTNF